MNRLVKIFLLVLLATAALYAWAVKFIAPQYLAQKPCRKIILTAL